MPSRNPKRGEVWVVDLGMKAKVRPCLVLTDPPESDEELLVCTVVAHTTSVHGSRWEVPTNSRFLEKGVFQLQQIQSVSVHYFQRCLGVLTPAEMNRIEERLRARLGL